MIHWFRQYQRYWFDMEPGHYLDQYSLRPSDTYMRQLSNHYWFRYWLVAWSVPSHYLNQCRTIVDWIPGDKLQWNLNRNLHIFIRENVFENVIRKMAAILSRPQCVKHGPYCHMVSLGFRELIIQVQNTHIYTYIIYVYKRQNGDWYRKLSN